jgi:hypothetical protein
VPVGAAVDHNSLEHLLTHLPKHPHCSACQRAKLVKKHARRRRVNPDDMPTRFGEQVTADHLISSRENSVGYDGSKYAIVIYDIATSYRDCFPTGDKDAIDARLALQQFVGPRSTVESFHCDGAKELYNAVVDLGMCPSTSRPYCSTSNAVAERQIRHVEEGTRTLLAHSGLPHQWWPLAARFFCHMCNIRKIGLQSAWYQRHGREYDGLRYPFGALVKFLPQKPILKELPKFAPRAIDGLFVG